MIRLIDGPQKYHFPPVGCFCLFLFPLWVRQQPVFSSLFRAWSGGILHCWWHRDLRAWRNLVSGNVDSPFLQIRSLTRETIPLLGAECPAPSATSGAHVTSTPGPRHRLPLHEMLTLLSFPQLFGATLDSLVLSYVQFYFLRCQFNFYVVSFFLLLSLD